MREVANSGAGRHLIDDDFVVSDLPVSSDTPSYELRSYDAERDLGDVVRIWREVRWVDDSDEKAAFVETFFSYGDAEVAAGGHHRSHRTARTARGAGSRGAPASAPAGLGLLS